jgi:diaminohydroxyphosphoribosylaminopyrimidine deaminase/5-amino-6-(5-phosphoribosylamino)uracil reductase
MPTPEELMFRCIELAQKGKGSVSPNPMVGCVIVKNGKIIGEGYHAKFGEAHAEVNAINAATESVEGSDVYINLEPCTFYGKTPPCVDLLIEKHVGRVYIAMKDPNPKVNGKGIAKLREAGIEVEVGLLSEEAKRLNEVFRKFITRRIPFVALKVAQSLDGKIALRNKSNSKRSIKDFYITSQESLHFVHELRSEYDAVLVGAGTVRSDDPRLNVRNVSGRSPVKIIIDGNLSTSPNSRVYGEGKTLLFYYSGQKDSQMRNRKLESLMKRGVQLFPTAGDRKGKIDLKEVLKKVASLNLASVLVEGGSSIFSQFVESSLADKLYLFVAPKIVGNGLGFADHMKIGRLSMATKLSGTAIERVGDDFLITGYF